MQIWIFVKVSPIRILLEVIKLGITSFRRLWKKLMISQISVIPLNQNRAGTVDPCPVDLYAIQLWCMRDRAKGVHLTMTKETIVTFAALASGEISAVSTWIEWIRRATNRVRGASEESLYSPLRHLPVLADDQSSNPGRVR